MNRRTFIAASAASAAVASPVLAAKPRAVAVNPLLTEWKTPYGAPPFASIKPSHFVPAFEVGMKQHLAEIAVIRDAKAAPTFENTIAAMERSGQTLTRAANVFYNLTGSDSNPALQKAEEVIAPKMAAHSAAINLDPALFARVKAVYDARETTNLTPEQKRLVERTYVQFMREGAALNPAGKKRLADIDQRLSALSVQFDKNLLADTKAWELVLESEADMAGLPNTFRAASAAAADTRGKKGKHVVTLSRSSVETFLQLSSRRDLRKKAFEGWAKRGDNGNANDNNKIIVEMVALRLERAKLLGFNTYADFALDDRMAKTPTAALGLMNRVWEPTKVKTLVERDELQKLAASEGMTEPLEAWDWRYYAEKVRAAKYNLDQNEVKPYFQLDKMLEAVFYTSGRLFGLTFKERKDIPVYHPDVRSFEVFGADGKSMGLFFGDYFARPSKQQGAWMNSFREQQKLIGDIAPIVVNNCNFNKGAPGEPALLSFDDATTVFHEFGHALHGLQSNVTYPTLSGTNVARDFVEFPSQIMEHWVATPEVLSRYAVHYKTGEPMPKALLDKVIAARNYGQGFATTEFMASALVDMRLHLLTSTDGLDLHAFEKRVLEGIGMPKEIIMRHRLQHFGHLFGGGYAAGYYSYTWAQVLDADAFQAFEDTGNVFDAATAKRLKDNVYTVGNTRDPMVSYVAFRGKEPSVEPMLKDRGLL